MVGRVENDLNEFRSAMDRGDMREAGRYFGILTTQMIEAAGGVAGITSLSMSGGRGVRRLVESIQNAKIPYTVGPTLQEVWKLLPFERGQAIEQALGHNLSSKFPVIDKFDNGLATSIKSIDLGAPTYQDAGKLASTIKGYINKVSDFDGGAHGGFRILPGETTGRALDLAIPSLGTATQKIALQEMMEYAAQQGVKLNFIVIH